ncbi:hypothetical protein ACFSR7_14375 [Cohnella sp. GCM10020058]|uniref:hypothetical protein n=1 Tax=Cohnella sp. GCM10020058 TaxID=3317330 RepID=UPI00363849C3
MSIFPGNRIVHDEADRIMKELLQQINPQNLKSIDNIKNWARVDDEVYNTDALSSEDPYYLFYKHPTHDFMDKLFLTSKTEVVAFLKVRVNPERGDGVDVIVAPQDYSKIIVCNHDGQIYLAK